MVSRKVGEATEMQVESLLSETPEGRFRVLLVGDQSLKKGLFSVVMDSKSKGVPRRHKDFKVAVV